MPNAALALIAALALESGLPHRADEAPLAGPRLERRIAERGPIRSRLEAALAMPAADIALRPRAAIAQAASNAPPQGDHFWAWFVAGCLALVVGFFVLAATSDSWF